MRALRIAAALAFVAALVLGCGQGALTAPEELDVPAPLFDDDQGEDNNDQGNGDEGDQGEDEDGEDGNGQQGQEGE